MILLWSMVASSIPTWFSYGFFWSMMILFGVMHGVWDIDEIQELYTTRSKSTIVGVYTGLMILTGLWWYLAPLVTTVVFTIVAAYHFGSEHRDTIQTPDTVSVLHDLLRWACVLIPLIGFQRTFSSSLLSPVLWVVAIDHNIILWGYGVVVVMRLCIHCYYYTRNIWLQVTAIEIALLIIVWLLAFYTNLYVSFWFYFGIAHGLPQILTLSGSSFNSLKDQYLTLIYSYPYMIIWTIIMRLLRYTIANYWFPGAQSIMVFLMFLGILTIPHVLMEIYPKYIRTP